MTPIAVLDSSVAIDLHRADMLVAFFKLPASFMVPDTMFADELEAWFGDTLKSLGLIIESLDDEEIVIAREFMRRRKGLSLCDAYALALAVKRQHTLLAGAKDLRELGTEAGIEVRGVLYVFDLIEEAQLLMPASLHTCLYTLSRTRRMWLPSEEVQARLERYSAAAAWPKK